VIQPQLPLRLPCSRWPPCRHGARTISSSSLPNANPGVEQTALSRVPRAHPHCKGPMVARRNIEPPEIGISLTARVVDAATADAFQREQISQLMDICVVLLHELDVEPCDRIAWRSSLRIEIAPCVCEASFGR